MTTEEEMHKKNNVLAVLIKKKKVFIFRRSALLESSPNMYEFPGGKVNLGETQYEAIQRHLSDKLSINVSLSNIHAFNNNIIEHDGEMLNIYVIKDWEKLIILNDKFHNKFLELTLDELKEFREIISPHKDSIPDIIKFLNIDNS